jgi:hypothetical protein
MGASAQPGWTVHRSQDFTERILDGDLDLLPAPSIPHFDHTV